MRILVTGSRDFTQPGIVRSYLLQAVADHAAVCYCGQITVVHGACPRGADLLADRAARANGWAVEPHPADWSLGKGAGHMRNQRMVDLGAHMLLAFFAEGAANRGTADCVERAELAGIEVRAYPPRSTPPVAEPEPIAGLLSVQLRAEDDLVPPVRGSVPKGVCGAGPGPCGATPARLFMCGWRCRVCAPKADAA